MKRDKDFTKALGALDPLSIQVDERTLLDRLSFAATYGELIAFYDKNNHKNGDWRPFFLKDPMILLAVLSKTDYSSKHMLFILLCKKLDALPDINWTVPFPENTEPGPEIIRRNGLFEQLFNLIQSIFIDINDWLTQMENDNKSYQLKEFVKKNVSLVLAPLLWRYMTIRSAASRNYEGIKEPDHPLFENFHPIWRTNINNSPIQLPIDANLLRLAQQIYQPLFNFYMQVIDSAGDIFNQLRDEFESPPDTALLIAFAQLMDIQQQQLNQMTKKHLDFYYREILKQNNKPAHADEAYLCLTLKKITPFFDLPSSTSFNAGVDNQQQAIIYANTRSQMLNQATIKQVKTLYYCSEAGNQAKKLHLNIIEKPSEIKKDPEGQLQSWPLLGDNNGVAIKQGFAFASPMLRLQNGKRILSICFEWAEVVSNDFFDGCGIYLSTEKDWFKTAFAVAETKQPGHQLCLTIKLNASDPAITPFKKNPDGFTTQWPLFKLVLSDAVDLTKPPLLKSMTIISAADRFGAFELYNDQGKVAENSSILPFGPIPAQGGNFYLGSSELFSKPLTKLDLYVLWDTLPYSMDDYYKQYNEFLRKLDFELQVENLCKSIAALTLPQRKMLCLACQKIFTAKQSLTLTPNNIGSSREILIDEITKSHPGISNKLDAFLKAVAKKTGKHNPLKSYEDPNSNKPVFLFDNLSFKVIFSIWNDAQWQNIQVDNVLENTLPESKAPDDIETSGNTGNYDEAHCVLLFNSAPSLKPQAQPALPAQAESAKPNRYGLILLNTPQNKVKAANASQLEQFETEKSGSRSQIFSNLRQLFLHLRKKRPAAPTAPPPAPQQLNLSSIFQFKPSSLAAISPSPALFLQPLDFSGPVKTGFLNMKLQQPVYGFGNNLYAQVVMDVTQQNAYQMVKASGKYTPKLLPNLPFVPKIAQLSVSYGAEQRVDFTNASDSYPIEFYHYDNFSAYQVYDGKGPLMDQRQTPGPGTGEDSFRLFAGITTSACLYLCLENVQPPCSLSLYFELSHFVALQEGGEPLKPAFYYLAASGWKTLRVLSDDTGQLACSGIVEVLIPEDISPGNPIMPDSAYWLAVASTNPEANFAHVVYLNTQAIKVKRLIPQGQSQLSQGQISDLVTPAPQIDMIIQPFKSFNGAAKEDDHAFYQRVSQRIKTKDRGITRSDFESMALKALPGLYFCKHITSPAASRNPGEVKLGLVNGYSDAMHPDAYRPVVNHCEINKIHQYFAGKISPFVQLKLFNLSHETVTINAGLRFSNASQVNLLCKQIALQLKVYLSPWIQTELPQINIDEGLSSAAITDYLTRLPHVEGVRSLTLSTEYQRASGHFIVFPADPQGLFVSAEAHEISAVVS